MRKTLFLLFAVIAMQLYAQKFTFIPKVGYNAAHISGLHEDAGIRHGVNAGLSVEYKFSRFFAIESGAYYSMQGAAMSYELGEDLITLDWDIENDYINIPFFIKGYVYKGLHIYGGPKVGFLVNSKLKIHGRISVLDFFEFEGNDNYDISGYLNNVDFSGVLGVGYRFDIGLLVSVNYNWGMNKVFNVNKIDIEDIDLVDLSDTRNKVFQVNIGWSF